MGKYYYGNPENSGAWEQTASVFAGHDSVNSEKTSSLALVQFWKPSKGRAKQFGEACGLAPEELLADVSSLCFEYPVPVSITSGGKGKPSMTDLMIITEWHAIAVEAKWKECREPYEPIGVWKNKDNQKNRERVLNGWVGYIEDCGYPVNREKIDDVAYQFLHRIASSCYVAKQKDRKPKVVYHLFYENNDAGVKKFTDKLEQYYRDLFNEEARRVPFYIIKQKVSVNIPQGMSEIAASDKRAWNELFVWMQKKSVYTFLPIEVIYDSP